jgi:PAS domain S-box-containing protein
MQTTPAHKKMTRKNDHLMEASFKYASIAIVVTNHQGDIELMNPYAEHLFGYTSTELSGCKIEQLVPERYRKHHSGYRKKFSMNPQNKILGVGKDLFARRKDGTELPVEVSLGHYQQGGEKYIIAFIRDITQRKQKENEITRLNEMLEKKVEERTRDLSDSLKKLEVSKEELQRLLAKEKDLNELKSRFVTMASHEFRTPLSTVLSSAYLLEKYCTTEDQPRRRKHIDRIISSVNMLTDILNDFLSVGKIEEGKITVRPATINIKDHIHTITGEMASLQKKGQHILHQHSGEEKVILDPAILKHIVMNLLSNAIKFSPEGSPIEVKSAVHKNKLILSIKDHGIGIPREDQSRLFERFHRGSNVMNIQGTGLGLHIVGKYTELMNGKIKCKTELEKGTEFILEFQLPQKGIES